MWGWEAGPGGGTYQSKWFRSGCGGLWPYNGEFVGTGLQLPFSLSLLPFSRPSFFAPLRVCGTKYTIAEAPTAAVVVPVVRSSLVVCCHKARSRGLLLFVFLVVAAATAGRLTSGCLPAAVLQWSVPARRRFLFVWPSTTSHNNFLYASLSPRLVASCSSLSSSAAHFFLSFWFVCVFWRLSPWRFSSWPGPSVCVCVFSVCFFVAFWRSENGRT